ncbi:MAG: hypothetical protein LWW85_02110 [Marinilabiliales bacterium]|nr:hypothetical protein [Marinilabiliales bacterium]
MNKRLLTLCCCLVLFTLFTSCSKDATTPNRQGGPGVEFYLLESFATADKSYQILESSVVTKETPLLTFADLINYNASTHTFKLSASGIEKVQKMPKSVYGVAFALKADGTVIYTGYFWPSYSSASCDWITIDPLMMTTGDSFSVNLGYPGLFAGMVIPDKRNDERLLEALRQHNKLIP